MTGVFSGAGAAHPSGAPGFTPVFIGIRVTRSLFLHVCFADLCLTQSGKTFLKITVNS